MSAMTFASPTEDAIPLHLVRREGIEAWTAALDEADRAWVEADGFSGRAGQAIVFPNGAGGIRSAAVGLGDAKTDQRQRFVAARARGALPKATYRLETLLEGDALAEAALGWLLAGYQFIRYAGSERDLPGLIAPEGVNAERLEAIAAGEALTRDLINTPASDMGPAELEAAARDLANRFGAKIEVIEGDALLETNHPMIHAVGRASPRAPRLIEMTWGADGPALTLVGKGVGFDPGGFDAFDEA